MSRLGDLVTMPLPTAWGPTVIPPVSPALPSLPASMAALVPPGSQLGWQRATNGWVMVYRDQRGNVQAVPGMFPVLDSADGAASSAYGAPNGGTTYALVPGAPPLDSPAPSLSVPQPSTAGRLPAGSTQPGSPWGRQPVLPNSVLPPAIQRGNPLLGFITRRPNAWDMAMKRHAAVWGYVRDHGGLKSCCRVPELGAPIWDQPPWITMPSQGEKFEQMYSQPISAFQVVGGDFSGVDVVLGQFVVPNGYDGALNRFVCQFTGSGFLDFTGSVVWRVLVNNRYARNLGNVQNTFGSFQAAFAVPGTDNIRLVSQQTVTLIANIPAGSPVAGPGVVAAGAFGWFYPRR